MLNYIQLYNEPWPCRDAAGQGREQGPHLEQRKGHQNLFPHVSCWRLMQCGVMEFIVGLRG